MSQTTLSLRADSIADKHILSALQERIGTQRFNAWFKHGTCVSVDCGRIKVSVPNPFVANWIETHYQSDIAAIVREQIGEDMPVSVSVDPSLTGQLRRSHLDAQAEMVSKAGSGMTRPRRPVEPQPLKYDLKDFVVGASNRLAHSAALAIVGEKYAPFNPLFVHGSCGVGKTHLIQGVCNAFSAARRLGQGTRWRYVTGEQFTNEFITALRHKKIDEFRGRYRNLDLLAIDDVHFLASKKATQDEFLHTYNAIDAAGKRVVMASDAPPHMVGELNEQLVSRFSAGLVVRIDSPDQATRMEILRRKARGMKLAVDDQALAYVAQHVRGSVRELEGTLVKLSALSALENARVSVQMAASTLADHLARTDSAVTVGGIEAVVAAFFGITSADICSSRRTRTVSVARMVAMFLTRRRTQMSYPEIGQCMGKNHSSAIMAVQRMETLLKEKQDLTWMSPAGAKSMPAEKIVSLLSEQIA
jgi:chromosomal replication initiator protein